MAEATTVRCSWCGEERASPDAQDAEDRPAFACSQCYTPYELSRATRGRRRMPVKNAVYMCHPGQAADAPAPTNYKSTLKDCGPHAPGAVIGSVLFRYPSRVARASATQLTRASCRAFRLRPEFSALVAEGAGQSFLTYLDRLSMFERFVLTELGDHPYREYLRQFLPDQALLKPEQIEAFKASTVEFKVR